MLIPYKTTVELNQDALVRLAQIGLTTTGPGGIARLLMKIVNDTVGGLYDTLQAQHVQAFLSGATGDNLDKIGEMLSCKRASGESDEAYRARIGQQPLSLERANETAIRLAALSVAGVKDVIMKDFTHGAGSFSIYVVTDDPVTPQAMLDAVDAAVQKVKAKGILHAVFRPKLIPVRLTARLIFSKKITADDAGLLRRTARDAVRKTIGALSAGEALDFEALHKALVGVSSEVLETQWLGLEVGGREALLVSQLPRWNERFVESDEPDAIDIR